MRFDLIHAGLQGHNLPPSPYALGSPVAEHAAMQGFREAQRNASDAHERRIRAATKLYADCLNGREDPIFIQEAMQPKRDFIVMELMRRYPGLYGDPGGRALGLKETMSVTDYQALFVDVLDRIYYGFYNAYPVVNKALVRTHNLRDFRVVSRYLLDGVVTPLTKMDPAAPSPQRALLGPTPQDGSPATTTAPLQYQPLLYQAMTSVNWRAIVNDDLGIFKDLANRLAIAGNRGISKFITQQYIDANGPHASLFTLGYHNIINLANGGASNNPPLSVQGLQDAFKILAGMKDSGGDPILVTGKPILFYGPSLVATAKNLINQLGAMVSVEGGTQNAQGFPTQFVQVSNWVVQDLGLVMDPYIPIVCTAGNKAQTTWGIIIDPNAQERPAIEVGWLNGFGTPQIYQKVPNTQRLGGGIEPMMGDFYSMDQDMKIVTVMGAAQIDGRSCVASNGSGQ